MLTKYGYAAWVVTLSFSFVYVPRVPDFFGELFYDIIGDPFWAAFAYAGFYPCFILFIVWLTELVVIIAARAIRVNDWKQRVANGDADAMFYLAVAHQDGRGVEKDEHEAARLYARAANEGHVDAMYEYAVCLRDGRGVPPNLDLARVMFGRAAHKGDDAAQRRLYELNESGGTPVAETHATRSAHFNLHHAGFWLRTAAAFLDIALFAVTYFIILQPAVAVGLEYLLATSSTDHSLAPALLLLSLLGPAIWWLYFSLMESSKYQGTLGKLAVGIKVTNLAGGRVSFLNATGRHFAKLLSGIPFGLGFVAAAFTREKQALHDLLARCYVVLASTETASAPMKSGEDVGRETAPSAVIETEAERNELPTHEYVASDETVESTTRPLPIWLAAVIVIGVSVGTYVLVYYALDQRSATAPVGSVSSRSSSLISQAQGDAEDSRADLAVRPIGTDHRTGLGYRLSFPGNWTSQHKVPPEGIAAHMTITNPNAGSIDFFVFAPDRDASAFAAQMSKDIEAMMSDVSGSGFRDWGRYRGAGFSRRGKISTGESVEVRIFHADSAVREFVVVEICRLYAYDVDREGFEQIHRSFAVRTADW